MAALSYQDYSSRTRFADLDGLRAIAVLAVIWHHTRPSNQDSLVAAAGHHGVTLFFAISGFLITTLLIKERHKTGRIDLLAFYWRRALRIFPLYYGTLAVYAILVSILEKNSGAGRSFWTNFPYFLTLTSNIFVNLDDARTIFYFAWSLATEEQFYLLWPPILFVLGTGGKAIVGSIAMLTLAIIGVEAYQLRISTTPLAIVGGALMALLMSRDRPYRIISALIGRTWTPPAALVGLALAASTAGKEEYLTHFFAVMLVCSCAVQYRHAWTAPLNSRPLVYIGSISYGMYMLHMLCKNVVTMLLSHAGEFNQEYLIFPLTVAVCVPIAALSFNYYEAAFLKLKHKYSR